MLSLRGLARTWTNHIPRIAWKDQIPAVRVTNQRVRGAASSSSTRWKSRQAKDPFTREARVQGLKSRAAFKLLEMDAKYKIFKKGQTVVDLGYAPGSWSQVAVERTKPNGRIIGIDIIPAQPPKGVSTIQGNFLYPQVQAEVRRFLEDPERGRVQQQGIAPVSVETAGMSVKAAIETFQQTSVLGRLADEEPPAITNGTAEQDASDHALRDGKKMVDVVLSDMLMNTTGVKFSDHAGSMDLCAAALTFVKDTLRHGGHFVCKFYQGAEDKQFEMALKEIFRKVHREKPESSRSESREAYFIALKRK